MSFPIDIEMQSEEHMVVSNGESDNATREFDSEFDVERARRDTPACEAVVHFNNAGASLMPLPVQKAFRDHFDLECRIGGYEAESRATDRIAAFYTRAAKFLNCGADEVAFTDSATRSWSTAFGSLELGSGDRVLIGDSEYGSNMVNLLHRLRRIGATWAVIPSDPHGKVDVAALESLIDDRVKLIAITHVPTNGGLVNPVAEVGRIARSAEIPYLLDACQSIGHLPLDVDEIGCDMLAATGRKYLRAPRGTGLLYVRRSLFSRLSPPAPDLRAADWTSSNTYRLRDDARRFETWESSIAGKLGLSSALDYAIGWGSKAIYNRITALAKRLRTGFAAMPNVTLRDLGVEKCGIVTFTVEGVGAAEVRHLAAERGINLWISPAESSRIDMEARNLAELVRASVHYYNTEQEIDFLLEVLAGALA